MPTTLKLKLKRLFSLGRLFASLRPKRDSPPPPSSSSFPTSIADLVVKNNGRLTKPPRSSDVPPVSPTPTVEAPNELTLQRELLAGGSGGGDDPTADRKWKWKWKWKRSLKKLVAKKKLESKDSFERPPDAVVAGDVADQAAKKIEMFSTEQTPPPEPGIGGAESVVVAAVDEQRRPVRFPLSVLVMVILLAGLLAGKIAAIALTVLCVALFSAAVHLLTW